MYCKCELCIWLKSLRKEKIIYLTKKLSLCHKLWFPILYIFATPSGRPGIFETMNYVG